MWRFQWLFVLLFYRVRYLPTTIRRYHRSGAGVILLRLCLSGFQFKFATYRLHYTRVIESKISVSNLNQISQNQIWDPGISKFEFGDDGRKLGLDITNQRRFLLYSTIMISYPSVRKQFTISREVGVLFLSMSNLKDLGITLRLDLIHKRRLILYLTVMGASLTFRKRITMSGAFGVRFLSAWMWVDDATWLRIRRSNQHVWVYNTIIRNYISFFRRVPKSTVLRCNGWIADFVFRKRKRWFIDKMKMLPKLESHTRLADKTKATKHIIRIAAPKLFCFFVTKIFDCIYILMSNITISGSY
ncbi:hypothetical protein ISN44_As12g021650 [Arabidopsis suecica]|uniref:Uncharacterized protein n=1 Tax=Arabidopsis suecica TaxID=45249 RepID=A0A8T1YL26_ARASU|nr:hypothetical protein ISN44_As12g021650 [Arabidopsis suecica]